MAQPSRIDVLTGRAGGGKAKSRIEELTGQSSSAAPSRLDQLTGANVTPAQERNSLPALEQEAQDVGAPAPAQDSPGLFRRAIDVLMRGNYAAAGAAEELFTPGGGGLGAVPGRVGSEIFSGIGSLQGKKHTFTQVLEEAGVGQLGQFSDLAPFLYNQTGEGIQLQKGGWADPTGRGALGTGLDIALDPTTYLGAGIAGKTAKVGGKFLSKTGQRLYIAEVAKAAEEIGAQTSKAGVALGEAFPGLTRQASIDLAKERVGAAIAAGADNLLDKGGIKWMGMHIADNPIAVIANSGLSKEMVARLAPTKAGQFAMASTAWVKKYLTDPMATLFVKGWGVRGLEGSRDLIDDALHKDVFWKDIAGKDLAASPLAKWAKYSSEQRDKIFQPVIDAFQKGGMAAVPEEFKDAMHYYSTTVDNMFRDEVASGLLTKDQKLQNYFAHYYRNDPEELARAVYMFKGGINGIKGQVESLLRMGRNAEERAYDTLAEAVSNSTRLNSLDKTVPILRPIYDPIEGLRRRWEHSITKRVNRELVTDLQKKFVDIPMDKLFDLAKPTGKIAAADLKTIQSIATGQVKDKIAAVKSLSDNGKTFYFTERFKQIGDRTEAAAVLHKYEGFEKHFPKYKFEGSPQFAADGSRFMEFNAGSQTFKLPESLAKEVAGMSDFVIKSEAGQKLLQGFDTVNNFWKGSVTWMFPSFHFRNLYSNVGQSFVDIAMHAINPKSYVETAHILFGKEPGLFKTAVGNYTFDEVRTMLNRRGINTSARAIAEFTGNESKILKPFKKFREFGTAIENESRAQLALNYMRRGMDDEEIGKRVAKFQLDYANGLTSFERQWMKRMIPFYAFQRLNLGLQLDNILKRPGMALAQVKPFLGRTDENEQMTSWNAGALKLRLNRDGKNVQMITGIDLPIRNLDLLFRGNTKDTMANAVGMLTPLLKVPIEVAANKSLFTGNDFVRANAPMAGRIVEQMPESMQKWMGYQKTFDKAGRPQYTLDAQRYYLIGQSYATSRILSTADRQWRQYIDNANGTALQSLLDVMTGLRFTDMNLEDEAKKKAAERTRDLEQALVRWGTRKEHRNTYVPKAGQK